MAGSHDTSAEYKYQDALNIFVGYTLLKDFLLKQELKNASEKAEHLARAFRAH